MDQSWYSEGRHLDSCPHLPNGGPLAPRGSVLFSIPFRGITPGFWAEPLWKSREESSKGLQCEGLTTASQHKGQGMPPEPGLSQEPTRCFWVDLWTVSRIFMVLIVRKTNNWGFFCIVAAFRKKQNHKLPHSHTLVQRTNYVCESAHWPTAYKHFRFL